MNNGEQGIKRLLFHILLLAFCFCHGVMNAATITLVDSPDRHSLDDSCSMYPCYTQGLCVYAPVGRNNPHGELCGCTNCLIRLEMYVNSVDVRSGNFVTVLPEKLDMAFLPETHLSTETDSSERRFSCDYPDCKYSTSTKSSLKMHKYTHCEARSFHCDHPNCKYSATNACALKRHKYIHCENKPYLCDYPGCKYGSSTASGLKKHKYVHGGEKPFQCSYPGCRYSTATKNNFHVHKKKHLGERRFKCGYPGCTYSNVRKKYIEIHSYTHGGRDPPLCDNMAGRPEECKK